MDDMQNFAILMLIFAGALFLYGFWVYRSRDISAIPKAEFSKIKNKTEYAKQFGKMLMWIACVPAITALSAFLRSRGIGTRPIVLTTIGNFIVFMAVGIKVLFGEGDNEQK